MGRHLKNVHGVPRQQQGALRRETGGEIKKDFTKRPKVARTSLKDSSYSETLSEKENHVSSSESYHPSGGKRMRAEEKPQESLVNLECPHSENQSKEI